MSEDNSKFDQNYLNINWGTCIEITFMYPCDYRK